MIQFSNWELSYCGGLIARQYDNLSRVLTISGDIPEGWEWALLTECGDNLNIIALSYVEGGLSVVLTDDMLSLPEQYKLQLRGTQGDVVRHTNIIHVYIPKSLSGDAQWPEVPSEFTQIEQTIIDINNNPPMPGENGYWMIYDPDTGEYVESDIPLPGDGSGGTTDHRRLLHRDAEDQHPIKAITDLEKEINRIPPPTEAITNSEIEEMLK